MMGRECGGECWHTICENVYKCRISWHMYVSKLLASLMDEIEDVWCTETAFVLLITLVLFLLWQSWWTSAPHCLTVLLMRGCCLALSVIYFQLIFPQCRWNRLINLHFYSSRWASLKGKKKKRSVCFCHLLTKRLTASCKDKWKIKSSASTYSWEISVFVSLNAAFHIRMDQYLTPPIIMSNLTDWKALINWRK